MKKKLIIGTRSSKLALWQTKHVKEELKKYYESINIELKEIKTKGDKILDVSLNKIGGKGLFTKEIEDALLNNEIDLAVHSLKDLPTQLPSGLKLGAILKREDPCDVVITRVKTSDHCSFMNLQPGSVVGTTSLRRIAQLKALRLDLEYKDLRGNLDTRIKKLCDGQYDAIVIAYAGVKRLGIDVENLKLKMEKFKPKEFLPACGQGAIAVEIRENDSEVEKLILKLNDEKTYLSCIAERSFLETLQGGCQTPIGIYSEINNDEITLYGMIASLDGKKIIKDTFKSQYSDALESGKTLAYRLLQIGGKEILTKNK